MISSIGLKLISSEYFIVISSQSVYADDVIIADIIGFVIWIAFLAVDQLATPVCARPYQPERFALVCRYQHQEHVHCVRRIEQHVYFLNYRIVRQFLQHIQQALFHLQGPLPGTQLQQLLRQRFVQRVGFRRWFTTAVDDQTIKRLPRHGAAFADCIVSGAHASFSCSSSTCSMMSP